MLHPAVALFLWGCLVTASQLLASNWLAVYGLLCLLAAVLTAGRRLGKLLRRSRFLILALVVLFAFFTPGQRLLDEPAWFPLTVEGLRLAAVQGGRLLCVITLVAVLLERLPSPELVQGMATLAVPMRLVKLDPKRLAVRLSLVLWLVADARGLEWKRWLAEPDPDEVPASIAISRHELGYRDHLVIVSLLVMAGAWLILAG